jgi:hypothetical protein
VCKEKGERDTHMVRERERETASETQVRNHNLRVTLNNTETKKSHILVEGNKEMAERRTEGERTTRIQKDDGPPILTDDVLFGSKLSFPSVPSE